MDWIHLSWHSDQKQINESLCCVDWREVLDSEELLTSQRLHYFCKLITCINMSLGQRWKEMRSTLSPAFTSSKMKTMFVLLSDCCQQFVQFLEQCYTDATPNGCNIEKGKILFSSDSYSSGKMVMCLWCWVSYLRNTATSIAIGQC